MAFWQPSVFHFIADKPLMIRASFKPVINQQHHMFKVSLHSQIDNQILRLRIAYSYTGSQFHNVTHYTYPSMRWLTQYTYPSICSGYWNFKSVGKFPNLLDKREIMGIAIWNGIYVWMWRWYDYHPEFSQANMLTTEWTWLEYDKHRGKNSVSMACEESRLIK